ncbi:MAG: GTPase ObgE, partial [Desulfovibrionales bacterium]
TFLKHVERTGFLVHLLSMEDISMDDPWSGFELVTRELALYSPELSRKKQIKVVNKIDLFPEEDVHALRSRAQDEDQDIFFISAKEGTGVEFLLKTMWENHLQQISQ